MNDRLADEPHLLAAPGPPQTAVLRHQPRRDSGACRPTLPPQSGPGSAREHRGLRERSHRWNWPRSAPPLTVTCFRTLARIHHQITRARTTARLRRTFASVENTASIASFTESPAKPTTCTIITCLGDGCGLGRVPSAWVGPVVVGPLRSPVSRGAGQGKAMASRVFDAAGAWERAQHSQASA